MNKQLSGANLSSSTRKRDLLRGGVTQMEILAQLLQAISIIYWN